MGGPPRQPASGAVLLFAPLIALGQVAPDAGSSLRELERPGLTLPPKPPAAPAIEQPARPALKPAPEVRFTLKAFRLSGNTAFAESELLPLVQDFVGREVGFAELEEAAARVTRFYRERGYPVARAYLPAQDIRDGTVEIAVLEGRLGKVELQNGSRLREAVVTAYLEGLPGQLIEERGFERKLLLLYDLAGVGEPRAALRPGANAGESDLALALERTPLATGAVELDNHGNRFTGGNRLSAQASLLSPTGSGDLLSMRLTKGDPGLDYGRIAYQLPVGSDGLKLGAAYSRTDYRLGRQFAPLQAEGEAESWNGFAAYPFIRSRGFNLHGQAGYERRALEDRVNATATVTPKKAEVTTLALSGDLRDGLAGGGVSAFSLGYASGTLDIQSPAAKAIDDASARTAGGYRKWTLGLLRLQSLTERLSLYLSYTVQQAGKNLDSSEKLVLGGANGVRAYPAGEAAGDSGSLLTAELRYATSLAGLPGTLQPFAFLDTGEVKVNQNPFAAGANRRRLSAGGAGVSWAKAGDFTVRLVVAGKIGHAPALSDTDARVRAWLQAAKFF